MKTFIIHTGTGTILDADDDVIVLRVPDCFIVDLDMEDEFLDHAFTHGVNIKHVLKGY